MEVTVTRSESPAARASSTHRLEPLRHVDAGYAIAEKFAESAGVMVPMQGPRDEA